MEYTSNVTNMSDVFSWCESLITLPDISIWNISNVTDMNHIFCGCKSLISLPDISKWNISYVKNMNNMFYECESLISLPDISIWNISIVTEMGNMFNGCKSLISLPDISKWNISNITNMNYIFYALIVVSIIAGAINGRLSDVVNSILTGAELSVKVAFSLIGIMAFWLGMMKIAEKCGLITIIAKIIKPITKKLLLNT